MAHKPDHHQKRACTDTQFCILEKTPISRNNNDKGNQLKHETGRVFGCVAFRSQCDGFPRTYVNSTKPGFVLPLLRYSKALCMGFDVTIILQLLRGQRRWTMLLPLLTILIGALFLNWVLYPGGGSLHSVPQWRCAGTQAALSTASGAVQGLSSCSNNSLYIWSLRTVEESMEPSRNTHLTLLVFELSISGEPLLVKLNETIPGSGLLFTSGMQSSDCQSNPFLVVLNQLLHEETLSYEALGMYASEGNDIGA